MPVAARFQSPVEKALVLICGMMSCMAFIASHQHDDCILGKQGEQPTRATLGAPRRLRFTSYSLAGCSLVRIVEEELIAVGIIDHQKPVSPRTLLDGNALGFEFRAQRV
jgi:hypothetical protein